MARKGRAAAPATGRAMQRAIAALPLPTTAMLVDKSMQRASRQIRRLLPRGKSATRELRSVLATLGTSGRSLPVLKGPGFSMAVLRNIVPISQYLSGLYLPADTPDILVPPARRYMSPNVATSTLGSGYAYSTTGTLSAVQSVDLATKSEFVWAWFCILIPTSRSRYGQLSRITVEAEIDWQVMHISECDPIWAQRLDGYSWLTSRMWLAAYQFNSGTGSWDPLPAPSGASSFQLLQSSWHVTQSGEIANSGSLKNGAATLQFLATSPPQTYLVAVLCQSWAYHTIRNVDGQPITPPQGGQFVVYALTKASVPAVWVTYETLEA